jgi:hypothetical protein
MNTCVYSSFIFWINVFIGIYYQEYIYASLFVVLFTTSTLFHYYNHNTFFLIPDLFIVFTIFNYVGYKFITKINKSKTSFFICFLFLLSLYLFFYGYYTNQYCYDVNKQIASLYHSLLHIIASLGHILVILL